ncbi:MAG: caspase family protein, partial [Promethearchaeota archaeon]
ANNANNANAYDSLDSSFLVGDPRDVYGLFIGMEDYPGTQNDLNYPDDDVFDMLALNYFSWGMTNDITLFDQNVNQKNITSAFQQMISTVDSNDLFIFYYSGHGNRYKTIESQLSGANVIETPHNYPQSYSNSWVIDLSSEDIEGFYLYFENIDLWPNDNLTIYDYYTNQVLDVFENIGPTSGVSSTYFTDKILINFTANGDGFTGYGFKITVIYKITDSNFVSLCPYDSFDPSSANYQNYYFTPEFLDGFLDQIKGKIMVFIDACHSGGFVQKLSQKNRFIATAARIDEESLESGDPYYNGLFTWSIYNIFVNPKYDPDGSGFTSLGELIENVSAQVPQISQVLGAVHHPVFSNQLGDNFEPENFKDTDGDGVSDAQEFLDLTSPLDPTKNRNVNKVFILSNVLFWILIILIPTSVVLIIYLHNNRNPFKILMDPFPDLRDKIDSPFVKESIQTFNALEIIKNPLEESKYVAKNRDVLGLFLNKGQTFVFENPKQIIMPLRCVCTNEDIEKDKIKDLPIQQCIYIYPKNSKNKNNPIQYAVRVPISEDALLTMEECNLKNAKIKLLVKTIFFLDIGLYIYLTIVTTIYLASVVFWLVILGLVWLIFLLHDKITLIDRYFMATRLDENRLEIRINNKEFAQIFKQLNNIKEKKI